MGSVHQELKPEFAKSLHREIVENKRAKTDRFLSKEYSEALGVYKDNGLTPKSELGKKVLGSKGLVKDRTLYSGLSFGLTKGEFLSKSFGIKESAGRTLSMMNPFSEAVKTDAYNFLGIMTKEQKMQQKLTSGSIKSRMGMAIPALLSGYAVYSAIKNDENISDALLTSAIEGTVVGYASYAARGIGGTVGVAASTGMRMGKIRAATRILGASLGAVTGAGAALNIMSSTSLANSILKMGKSDNEISNSHSNFIAPSMYGNIGNTKESYTMRQKTLAKISASGINDRSMIMGNEALVLRGLI